MGFARARVLVCVCGRLCVLASVCVCARLCAFVSVCVHKYMYLYTPQKEILLPPPGVGGGEKNQGGGR